MGAYVPVVLRSITQSSLSLLAPSIMLQSAHCNTSRIQLRPLQQACRYSLNCQKGNCISYQALWIWLLCKLAKAHGGCGGYSGCRVLEQFPDVSENRACILAHAPASKSGAAIAAYDCVK